MAILILRNLFISFLNAEIRSNIFIRKWEISMFYLALFGLFLFAGRIGETVRVRDGGGVKGGGGGGDRLGGVPAHQLGGGQRWGRFRGAHSRAGGWILLLQGVSLFSLIYIFFGYQSTIFKDVVTTYKRWFPVCRWSRSIRFSLRQDEAWRSEPFLEEIFVFLYVTAIGSKLSVKALRTGWCILYSFLRV